jgi:hypothetical protein
LEAATPVPPAITTFKVEKSGKTEIAWTGATNRVVVEVSRSVGQPEWQAIPGTDWPIEGSKWVGVVPAQWRDAFVRVVTYSAGGAPLPSKVLSFDVIGIHDSGSTQYNSNCVGCHGNRLTEKSIDGKLPAAHAIMRDFFGDRPDSCVRCHVPGPDFLTQSAGGLRKQADYERASCYFCHDGHLSFAAKLYNP